MRSALADKVLHPSLPDNPSSLAFGVLRFNLSDNSGSVENHTELYTRQMVRYKYCA